MYLLTGSSSLNLPSSNKIIIATPVIGLVIDAMRKIVSRVIGRVSSRLPQVRTATIRPWRISSVAMPLTSPRSTMPAMVSSSRFNRSVEKPTASGVAAFGSECVWACAPPDPPSSAAASNAPPSLRPIVRISSSP